MEYAPRPNKHAFAMLVGGPGTVANWTCILRRDGPGTTTQTSRGRTFIRKGQGIHHGEATSSKTRQTRNYFTSSRLRWHTAADLRVGDHSAPSSGPSRRRARWAPTHSRRFCSGHSTITRRPSTAQQTVDTYYTVSVEKSKHPIRANRKSSITPSRYPARWT